MSKSASNSDGVGVVASAGGAGDRRAGGGRRDPDDCGWALAVVLPERLDAPVLVMLMSLLANWDGGGGSSGGGGSIWSSTSFFLCLCCIKDESSAIKGEREKEREFDESSSHGTHHFSESHSQFSWVVLVQREEVMALKGNDDKKAESEKCGLTSFQTRKRCHIHSSLWSFPCKTLTWNCIKQLFP